MISTLSHIFGPLRRRSAGRMPLLALALLAAPLAGLAPTRAEALTAIPVYDPTEITGDAIRGGFALGPLVADRGIGTAFDVKQHITDISLETMVRCYSDLCSGQAVLWGNAPGPDGLYGHYVSVEEFSIGSGRTVLEFFAGHELLAGLTYGFTFAVNEGGILAGGVFNPVYDNRFIDLVSTGTIVDLNPVVASFSTFELGDQHHLFKITGTPAPVPLPAGGVLLLSALGAIAAARHKSRA